MSFEKPKKVLEAQFADKHEILSRMGRRGAQVATEHRRIEREYQQREEALRKDELAEEFEKARLEKNEDITPEGDVVPL